MLAPPDDVQASVDASRCLLLASRPADESWAICAQVISSLKFNYAAGSPTHKTAEKCCEWSPFELLGSDGRRARPAGKDVAIRGANVTLEIPSGFGAVAEVRYAYQDIVLCALYAGGTPGQGATGNESVAMPARPFRRPLKTDGGNEIVASGAQ